MKYEIQFTSQFKKDLKLAKKQNKDIDKLMSVIEKIARGESLEAKFNPLGQALIQHFEILGGNFPWNRIKGKKPFIKFAFLVDAKFYAVTSQLFINDILLCQQFIHTHSLPKL